MVRACGALDEKGKHFAFDEVWGYAGLTRVPGSNSVRLLGNVPAGRETSRKKVCRLQIDLKRVNCQSSNGGRDCAE